jgi:capsular polysaccharide transport system permease protein
VAYGRPSEATSPEPIGTPLSGVAALAGRRAHDSAHSTRRHGRTVSDETQIMSTPRLDSNFVIAERVIGALIVRDARTRSGRSAIGFLKSILVPFGHLALVVVVYTALGRVTPIGTDTITFLTLGVMPFILFMYPARMTMVSLSENRPLLYFPNITILSIVIARAILEVIASSVVCCLLIGTLIISGHEFSPDDSVILLFALLSAVCLGVAFGFLNASIALVFPTWQFVFNVGLSGFYAGSCLMFLPDFIPAPIRNILSYNPLLHSVEWVRVAYYDQYTSSTLDLPYLFWFTASTLLVAFALERSLRRVLLTH